MEKYRILIKQIADLYSADIRNKPKDYQKILAFDIKDEIDSYIAERRLLEGSKQYKEKTKWEV